MGGLSTWQRAQRVAPNPQAHRVSRGRPKRRDAERKRQDEAAAGVARALVLPWVPASCPKCSNPVLRHETLEVACVLCGWCQMVRR